MKAMTVRFSDDAKPDAASHQALLARLGIHEAVYSAPWRHSAKKKSGTPDCRLSADAQSETASWILILYWLGHSHGSLKKLLPPLKTMRATAAE